MSSSHTFDEAVEVRPDFSILPCKSAIQSSVNQQFTVHERLLAKDDHPSG